jgi:hypothetical protein
MDNGLESAMKGMHMVKPYPSSEMPKAALKHIDLSKYNHNSDCECKECGGDCPLSM